MMKEPSADRMSGPQRATSWRAQSTGRYVGFRADGLQLSLLSIEQRNLEIVSREVV